MKKTYIHIISAIVFLASCTSEDDLIQEQLDANPLSTPTPETGDAGTANFEHMVAFGASFAAGVMDGALYDAGQQYSYPAQIAKQLMIEGVGGGAFNQPDINAIYGLSGTSNGILLGRFFLNLSTRTPNPIIPGDPVTLYTGDKLALNNFGVGGIILAQALTPFTGGPAGNANPAFNGFYQRFATAPGTSTILADAIATNPTFFTSSLGGNDLLDYAVSGGSGTVPITSAGDFQQQYTTLVSAMVAAKAKGVIMNIPPVTFLPYFRAVPYNPIPIRAGLADTLNAAYKPYNDGLKGALARGAINEAEAKRRTIAFAESDGSPFVMEDENLTDLNALGISSWRMTEQNDLVLLPAAARFSEGLGTRIVAGDQRILTIEEQTEIVTGAVTFTAIINGVADAANKQAGETVVGVVDIYPLLADVTGLTKEQAMQLGFTQAGIEAANGERGIKVGGASLQPDFSPNGIYSTDGIHPNPRGYALFANAFIGAINKTFKAKIPAISDEQILALRSIYFR